MWSSEVFSVRDFDVDVFAEAYEHLSSTLGTSVDSIGH